MFEIRSLPVYCRNGYRLFIFKCVIVFVGVYVRGAMAEVNAVARAKQAIESGDVALLEKQLSLKEIHPDERIGSEGFSFVHWACYYGKFEVCLHKLRNIIGGQTCAQFRTTQMQVLQKLLFGGGSVDLVEKHGWTPAHVCAIRGENTCLQVRTGPSMHSD